MDCPLCNMPVPTQREYGKSPQELMRHFENAVTNRHWEVGPLSQEAFRNAGKRLSDRKENWI